MPSLSFPEWKHSKAGRDVAEFAWGLAWALPSMEERAASRNLLQQNSEHVQHLTTCLLLDRSPISSCHGPLRVLAARWGLTLQGHGSPLPESPWEPPHVPVPSHPWSPSLQPPQRMSNSISIDPRLPGPLRSPHTQGSGSWFCHHGWVAARDGRVMAWG